LVPLSYPDPDPAQMTPALPESRRKFEIEILRQSAGWENALFWQYSTPSCATI